MQNKEESNNNNKGIWLSSFNLVRKFSGLCLFTYYPFCVLLNCTKSPADAQRLAYAVDCGTKSNNRCRLQAQPVGNCVDSRWRCFSSKLTLDVLTEIMGGCCFVFFCFLFNLKPHTIGDWQYFCCFGEQKRMLVISRHIGRQIKCVFGYAVKAADWIRSAAGVKRRLFT